MKLEDPEGHCSQLEVVAASHETKEAFKIERVELKLPECSSRAEATAQKLPECSSRAEATAQKLPE